MYYCEKCHRLCEEDHCLNCNKKNLREVSDDDYCFLIEKEMIWCEMLKEILTNYDIPYIYESTNGAAMGLNLGVSMERYQVFTPYAHYEQAKQIMKHMFDESDK